MARFAPPRWVWPTVAASLAFFCAIEVPLIVVFLNHEGVFRIQTVNGVLVIAGGLVGILGAWLIFMWPLKRMSIRMLLMQEDLRDEVQPAAEEVKRTATEVLRIVEKFRDRDFANAERAIERIAKALDAGVVERLESHLAAIRKRIERDTDPVKVLRREVVDEAENRVLFNAPGVAENGHHDGKPM